MAQLIKLQDYISRYEIDLKRYPTQFIRLKTAQWSRMKEEWETGALEEDNLDELFFETPTEEKKGIFQKLNPFKKRQKQEEMDAFFEAYEQQEQEQEQEQPKQKEHQEENIFTFQATMLYKPEYVEDLRRMYMDQLFSFQLKWASSTIREKSNIAPHYQRDTFLKELLQGLPDTFFVLYEPILIVKKAPVELGVIIITPTDCYCIEVLEAEEHASFTGDSTERFWQKRVGEQQKNLLNPMIALNRMEVVAKQLLHQGEVDLSVKKLILCRNGYIDYPGSAFGVEFIDRRTYKKWFDALRKHHSPMKHMQFKAAETLLTHSQTTSFMRAEWYTDNPTLD